MGLQVINENFSCTEGTEFELSEDGKTCRCVKGIVYVLTANCTGIAAGKGAKAVGAVDGFIIQQETEEAEVVAVADNGTVLKPISSETKQAIDTGTSRASGCNGRQIDMADFSRQM
jgi:hypothetical protein